MNINFNVPLTMMQRLVDAVERLASDYADVHRETLANVRYTDLPVDKDVGETYYQDDRAIFDEELKARLKREEEYGPEPGT